MLFARQARFLGLLSGIMSVSGFGADVKPLPLPKTLRVESAGPRGTVWQKLAPKEKKLAQHLIEASQAGRALLFHQTHRHSLALRAMLETAFLSENQDDTKALLGDEGYRELLVYAAKFLDQGGPYASSNRKYLLSKVTAAQAEELFRLYAPAVDPTARHEAVKLLTDPTFETQQFPESPDGANLELTGGNLYEHGITGAEVKAALDKTLKTTLNCRVVRARDGLGCETMTVKSPGIVGETLRKVVQSLRKARLYASTPEQGAEIDRMIRYFERGDVEDFRQANIAWVKDGARSTVDFMLGWVEVYEDWLARIGSWESYVQIVDPDVSKRAQALAKRAQYFEDNMPYGEFKKKFPADYSPPAIMVYYFQEIASYRSGGYNLPNFDDIRRDVGAKNVIRLPMPGEDLDPEVHGTWEETLKEFAPAGKVQDLLANRELIWQNIVLMHEIIGHGSGTYDVAKYPNNEDPISGLGALGSALEEQRADLAALTFLGDPKLVEIGLYKDAAEALRIRNLGYDYYLADFLRRTSGQRTLTEAHQRGHWLFVHRLLQRGAAAWASKDGVAAPTPGNQVLVVKDYDKYYQISRELLGELQRIKAVRDEAGLKALFATEAPLEAINEPWAQAIILRGESLRINAGYVEQPWRIARDGRYEGLGGKTLEAIAEFWKLFY